MSDIGKIRRMLGMSQQNVADQATLTRSIISEVESKHKGLSVAASLKASPVLQVHPGILYLGTQLVAIKTKLEEEEITEEQASEKLLRVLRTVLEKFEDIEEEAEADALITALEELLEETTGKTVENVRSGGAKAATKSAGIHPAFNVALKYASGGIDGRNFDVDDGRDAFGIRRPDLDGDYQDEDDFPEDAEDDGRNIYGVRTRPLDGQGR